MRGRFQESREEFHRLAISCPAEKKYRVYMHYARGREYAANNEIERAKAEYRRALALDPEHRMALGALQELGGSKPASRGLFSRLFGK